MKQILFLIIGITVANSVISQTASPELVSTSGDSFNNTTYQLDWSIGECVTATFSGENNIITQGFHQNSYVVSITEDLKEEFAISVYPNPTSDFINLELSSYKTIDVLGLTVSDASGQTLQSKEIKSRLERINFSDYIVGTYFIIVHENNKNIKTFKIIKN